MPTTIDLLAIVFNQLSHDLGGFRERIRPQAVDRTLGDPHADVLALINHNPDLVLARRANGHLVLSKTDRGLRARITPPKTSFAADLLESLRRRDVAGASFAFRVMPEGDRWLVERGQVVREVLDMAIFDVSAVASPAYPQTTAAVRAVPTVPAGRPVPASLAPYRMRLLQLQAAAGEARAREVAWLADAAGRPAERAATRARGVAFLEAVRARFGSLAAAERSGLVWNEARGWHAPDARPAAPPARRLSPAERKARLEQLEREIGRRGR